MKTLGVVLGLGLVGAAAFAAGRSRASVVEPETEPEPAETPGEGGPDELPAPIPDPLPASGNSEPRVLGENRQNLLPPELSDIDLSGNEVYEYRGIAHEGPFGGSFHQWVVHGGLNGMPMLLWVETGEPENWISVFVKKDGPGSVPPSHRIIYKVTKSPASQWLIDNIGKAPQTDEL